MKKTIVIISACISLLFGCKEVYYPDIDDVDKLIVVEGLITTEPGPHRIRLSYTADFYNRSKPEPVENARVIVFENNNEEYEFLEVRPGTYYSPSNFSGVVGSTYTLQIFTSEGLHFSSHPQKILPPYHINSMQADSSIRTNVRESNSGNLVVTEIDGVEASIQLDNSALNDANIRFETSVIAFYTYEAGGFFDPVRFYCWKMLSRFEGIDNINLPTTSNHPGDVSNNVVAFLPYNKSAYLLEDYEDLLNLAVGVKVYSINDDAYAYYLDVNKQLKSDGSLFAPIPSQIRSNIYCVTDSSIPAVGLFEASSASVSGFVLRTPPFSKGLEFEYTENYSYYTFDTCFANGKPPYWVD